MAEQPRQGSKHKRLGNIATSSDPPTGRLGQLRVSAADKAEAGPSSARQTTGGVRKVKFAPVVPARRKKTATAEAEPSTSAAAAPVGDFSNLIKQAQTDAAWERPRGRPPWGQPQQKQRVTFGGGAGLDHSRVGSSGGASSSAPGSTRGEGGASTSGASLKRLRKAGDADGRLVQGIAEVPEEEAAVGPLLDYGQYYPTVLPMQTPETEAQYAADAAEEEWCPPDLTQLPEEDESNAAEELGLLRGGSEGQLLLLQLPPLLPSPPPHRPPDSHSEAARRLQLEADANAAPNPLAVPPDQLDSGKLGKLLVFRSGKVKLQVGEVLLDVLQGAACAFRQDVAAVNPGDGHMVLLGAVAHRAVCVPDIAHLLGDEAVPEWPRELQDRQSPPPATASLPTASARVMPKMENGDAGCGHEDHAAHVKVKEEETGGRLVGSAKQRTGRATLVLDDDDS